MDFSATYSARKPSVVISPLKGLFQLDLAVLWHSRELLYFLVWRDVILRFKQTVFGGAWVIIQPVTTMVIFTLVFGGLAKMPSEGIPYPVFSYCALLPWSYFSAAVTRSSSSVVVNNNLVTKIYFPRLLIPLAASIAPLIDLLFAFLVLVGMMAWFKVTPGWQVLALPLFLALAIAAALAVGLWSAALNVKYRDVGNIIPFLLQAWMYASPIAYPASMVPAKWRFLYSLNPLVAVIDGFRWALTGKGSVDPGTVACSVLVVSTLLIGGVLFFRRMEQTFADVI